MARPNNAPMGAGFKKMNKDSLIRLLVDEMQKNIKLQEENEMLKCKGGTPEKVGHEEFLKEENELLKQCLDKLMFDADVVNVKIHGELGDYVYVRSDKQFKLNVKD